MYTLLFSAFTGVLSNRAMTVSQQILPDDYASAYW